MTHEQQDVIGPRLSELGQNVASYIAEWLGEWARRDPDTVHYHLGPVAVLPEFQRQGIGKLMMKHFCKRVDEVGAIAYLETEMPENVSFYEKSGFSVTEKVKILGVPNWFMTRPAQTDT